MRAGARRTPLVIQTPTQTQDASGGVTRTWATFVAQWWAEIVTASATESFVQDQREGRRSRVVRGEYVTGVTSQMRLQTPGGQLYQIEGVVNMDERNRLLELSVRETT